MTGDKQQVRISTREPQVWFDDYPGPGLSGEFQGDVAVRIRDGTGAILAQRAEPRAAFRGLRRQLWWDDLDFLYFAGYAIWNYLTAPFLYAHPGCAIDAMAPQGAAGTAWRCLRVRFPPDVPTHCVEQIVHVDEQGRLMRLDYTAEVVGPWARAANVCDDHRWFGGLLFPTRRRVTPRAFGRVLPRPTLVEIAVHEVRGLPAGG